MSTIGSDSGHSPTWPVVVMLGAPFLISVMSADVPPMSTPIRSLKPAASPTKAMPTAPAAGPESAVSTGALRTLDVPATPPLDFISSRGASMRFSRMRSSSRAT
jgi:hypothetical protein